VDRREPDARSQPEPGTDILTEKRSWKSKPLEETGQFPGRIRFRTDIAVDPLEGPRQRAI
jgi:hypothetical protein